MITTEICGLPSLFTVLTHLSYCSEFMCPRTRVASRLRVFVSSFSSTDLGSGPTAQTAPHPSEAVIGLNLSEGLRDVTVECLHSLAHLQQGKQIWMLQKGGAYVLPL